VCEIAEELQRIHKWIHRSCEALSAEDIEQADQLGGKILDVLNEVQVSNGIKLLAIYDVMTSGAAHMEEIAEQDQPDVPGTIN
jgi:hypothetical protein